MTTMLAIYRLPEGGAAAIETFERRYAEEHLPLMAATPGLLGVSVRRVTQTLLGDRDIVLVASMEFADRASLDASLTSDEMRAASRNLREIAPGLTTLLILEDVPEMDAAASLTVDTVDTPVEDRQ